jgi:glycosyltransferase involved in cell wall biosynthesis
VIGNALETVEDVIDQNEHVRRVGWVPSVAPYLERARVSVIPLLHGAGTKRKLIQALMVGTPSVSTSIGIEGLGLEDGTHVRVADDPAEFARCVAELAEDRGLWDRLVAQGRDHSVSRHGREAVRARFAAVIAKVMTPPR